MIFILSEKAYAISY